MSTSINPNDTVRIKLTAEGKRQIVAADDAFNEHMRKNHPLATYRAHSKWDNDGWIEGQFWTLMQHFKWDGIGGFVPFTEMVKK